ncbi:MAG: hypothetical protein HFJ86_03450 [Oscillospiraceae bacterium]|nr:hypothetical protein [Oscillospiraceae bacterium]
MHPVTPQAKERQIPRTQTHFSAPFFSIIAKKSRFVNFTLPNAWGYTKKKHRRKRGILTSHIAPQANESLGPPFSKGGKDQLRWSCKNLVAILTSQAAGLTFPKAKPLVAHRSERNTPLRGGVLITSQGYLPANTPPHQAPLCRHHLYTLAAFAAGKQAPRTDKRKGIYWQPPADTPFSNSFSSFRRTC